MSKKTNNYLPSITTRPIQSGGESSGAKDTRNVDDEMLPIFFYEILSIMRYKNAEVNEDDLKIVEPNTTSLLQSN